MTNRHVFSVLAVLLFWGISLVTILLFVEKDSFLSALAVMVPVLLASIVIWLQHDTFPKKGLSEIDSVARKIENNLEKDWTPIELTTVPQEIRPLVTAINTLLRFHVDRYQQERDFTAHASHELRTPLAGIRLQTELAMATNDPEKQDKAHRNILKAVDRGTRLVEQLLTISRLTADRVDLAMENTDMVALARYVVAERLEMAEKENTKLTFEPKVDSLFVIASEESIKILLDNLIRNALFYTPRESLVTVSVRRDGNEAVLEVTDNGSGIPKHLREIVFRRFEKGERTKGTGLGLSIVKRIINLHEGKVSLDDGQDGKGLKVTVTLPIEE